MDHETFALAAHLVSQTYANQAEAAHSARRKLIKSLLSQRRLPERGWDEASIERLLQDAAMMDSNNFPGNVGVGEREARVACPLVERRHYRMAHGVGRSGDIAAIQPKAAGSSLLAQLTNLLALDALRVAGLRDASAASVLPLATGMALASTLQAIRRSRPRTARYVLWPRIDQKTCVKCVSAANLDLVVIPEILEGDELRTDTDLIASEINRLGVENCVAVLSTTSCFAPRAADQLVEIAKLCQKVDVPHVVNNAYGVQAEQLCSLVVSAWRKGRVDAVVQSTDKNFMVPVGGSIVAAGPGKRGVVDAVNAAYPGRAAAGPMLDLLITLLHWGVEGWQKALKNRHDLWDYAKRTVAEFASKNGCRLLQTPGNPISVAMTLDGLAADPRSSRPPSDASAHFGGSNESDVDPPSARASPGADSMAADDEHSRTAAGIEQLRIAEGSARPSTTLLGSMLFSRCVSGTRVVARGKTQSVEGIAFKGYGAHCDAYPHDYLTMAVALGTRKEDIDEFVSRLEGCFKAFRKKSLGS